jgi:thymidylate synthase (FAD)
MTVGIRWVDTIRPELDKVPLLDHGYLEFVEHWGSDTRIIEAARMSTDKGFVGWGPLCRECADSNAKMFEGKVVHDTACSSCDRFCDEDDYYFNGDEKLLKYLYDHKHATPFEMSGMTIVVQAPIFVFREWHRHRTQSYNEMSGRYTPLPDLNYVPSIERLMLGSDGKNKQAGTIKGAGVLTEEAARGFQKGISDLYARDQETYEWALQAGVPKELARVHLPVGRYSRMMASANLRNWLAFLTLRMDNAAQWEIRQFANAVGEYISMLYPRTWDLFCLGRNK